MDTVISPCGTNPTKLPSEDYERKHDQNAGNCTQQAPCSPAGETVESRASLERDQGHIQYLLKKLPVLSETFNIHRKVGEGTFSSVFLGTLKHDGNMARQFAIKHLVPTTLPARTERELQCLQEIGGSDNVIGIDICLRQDDCVVFVMPYLPHRRFSDYVQDMGVQETREYMRNLFVALRRVHSFNIIHRDIKPSNFLYDRESKRFLLVDFGLAQCVSADSMVQSKKRKHVDDENAVSVKKQKRAALQPRTNDSNIMNTAAHLSPARKKVFGVRNENTPPEARKAPRCRTLQTDHSAIKKKLFPGPKFQTLAPHTPSGTSFVRVQNSQVFSKPSPVHCKCHGKAQVCAMCMAHKVHAAPRAGTPGFRPPEVLLKYPQQTTAVDMWAAGIVLLCILSGCYPFFRSPDDLSALAELMAVFGTERIKQLGMQLGRLVTCSVDKKALNLRTLCERLRQHQRSGGTQVVVECQYPQSAYDLLERLLDLNPDTRITAAEALQHPFVSQP